MDSIFLSYQTRLKLGESKVTLPDSWFWGLRTHHLTDGSQTEKALLPKDRPASPAPGDEGLLYLSHSASLSLSGQV